MEKNIFHFLPRHNTGSGILYLIALSPTKYHRKLHVICHEQASIPAGITLITSQTGGLDSYMAFVWTSCWKALSIARNVAITQYQSRIGPMKIDHTILWVWLNHYQGICIKHEKWNWVINCNNNFQSCKWKANKKCSFYPNCSQGKCAEGLSLEIVWEIFACHFYKLRKCTL